MRKLLLFLTLCLSSIGAWAYSVNTNGEVWSRGGCLGYPEEKVAKINISAPGELTAALAELANRNYDYQVLYISGITYGTTKSALSEEDLQALEGINVATLDLQNLQTASTFTFSNPYVERVILPDYWDKDAVKAVALAIAESNTNFEAALSQHGKKDQSTQDAGLVAYVAKPGKLHEAMLHTFWESKAENKMGGASQNYVGFDKLAYVSIMGYPSARDFSGSGSGLAFDENGHFVFNVEADETKEATNAGVGGVERKLIGTELPGALTGNKGLISLDLGDATIYEEWCNDLTFSWTNSLGNYTRQVVFPKNPELKTIPADCLSSGGLNSLEEIEIPGTIENIKTRAFNSAARALRHVWTTGTDANTRYDNGAYNVPNYDEPNHYGHAPLDDPVWGVKDNAPAHFGTITLPPAIKLIESHAFLSDYARDLYVLTTTAPECHVDAFSSIMLYGNNTIDNNQAKEDGMITRNAYVQSLALGQFITMLHYPRETTTPDIQRYTDPTREYKVATTLRDAKGNIIYFPNQSEMNRAYQQGTTGYLWNAWDGERVPNGNNENSFVQMMTTLTPHDTNIQEQANEMYRDHPGENASDRSFYDVRLGTGEQPVLEMPEGLDWYYKTVWEGEQLYPEMEAENGNNVLTQVQATDEDGYKLWNTCPDGTKVQDYEYVKQDDGELVWDITATEDANGSKVKDYTYVEDPEGDYYRPMVARDWNVNNPPYYNQSQTWVEDNENPTNVLPQGWSNADWTTTVAEFETWDKTQYPNAVYVSQKTVWTEDSNGQWMKGTTYAPYTESTTLIAGVNDTRYSKVYKDTYRDYNASTDAGEQRYNVVDNGLEAYEASNPAHATLDRYHKAYKEHVYRDFDASKDAADETRYCPTMEDVYELVKGDTHDYRGWHQFVLAAYGDNSIIPQTHVTFYQSDDDWWTICLPYDLKYNEMTRFFGTSSKLPYVCKLLYVVRDYDLERITLMFSQNLMEYKEDISGTQVHGNIDNTTKWTDTELEANPVILHAGVPYLIRPAASAYKTWDILKDGEDADLYNRLTAAEKKDADTLEGEIYNGEYTVPAYVVGEGSEGTQESITIENKDGYSKTYNSGKITYRDSQVDAKISSAFKYTFVGSYFISRMPQYSYFLGWDSKKNKAAFWYNAVTTTDYTWNNQTGIICPNFNTDLEVDPSTSLSDPARWIIGANDCKSDDLVGVTKKSSAMAFGGSLPSATGIEEVATVDTKTVNNGVVYNINGQLVRTDGDLQGLSKGVYIVNGKKHVVK